MSTAQVVEQLEKLSDAERLEVIEAATRMVRENLAAGRGNSKTERDHRMRAAATGVKDLYELGSELTVWTALDAEDFVDEHLPG